jgi:hypothetical protein
MATATVGCWQQPKPNSRKLPVHLLLLLLMLLQQNCH